MEPEMSRLITGAMIAMEGNRERYLREGRRFARLIAGNVDPNESRRHRQAVEDAREVLEQFDEEDGSLDLGADRLTVVAAIATLMDHTMELLGPRDLEILGAALSVTS
jgi:hypothetical protein